jgi:hypothetical protein
MVAAAYTGWAAYASLFIFRPYKPSTPTSPVLQRIINVIAIFVLLIFFALFHLQKSPWTFYVYIAFPCYFWQQFLVQVLPHIILPFRSRGAVCYVTYALHGGLVTAALQLMVVRTFHCIASSLPTHFPHTGCLHTSINLEYRICSNRRDLAPHPVACSRPVEQCVAISEVGHGMHSYWSIPSSCR